MVERDSLTEYGQPFSRLEAPASSEHSATAVDEKPLWSHEVRGLPRFRQKGGESVGTELVQNAIGRDIVWRVSRLYDQAVPKASGQWLRLASTAGCSRGVSYIASIWFFISLSHALERLLPPERQSCGPDIR
jgi:hypothetical protein